MAKHKLRPISNLFIPQVSIPQIFFFSSQTTAQNLLTISERKSRKTVTRVLDSIYIPRALMARRVEISEEEIPGSKRSMYGYILTYSRLKRESP